MSSLKKFWISSTFVLFLLALWPFMQSNEKMPTSSESEFRSEALLVDHFCLGRISMGGKAVNPRAWEEVLGAEIKLRESAGEAAGEARIPLEQSSKLTNLKPGEGALHVDDKFVHYVLKSAQGRDWYLVLTKKNTGDFFSVNPLGNRNPSPLALAIGFALVGGGLMTLLARVAFGKVPETN